MKTVRINLYTYKELSDKAQERARNWAYEFCADGFDDFDGLTGFTADEIKRYGLNYNTSGELVRYSKKYFDLDRNSHLELVNPSWNDEENARKFLQIPAKLWGKVYCSFTTKRAGWQTKNTTIQFEPQDYDEELTTEENKVLDAAVEIFDDRLQDWIRNLQSAYDYCFTEEHIADLMEANEYTFTESGERHN